MTKLNTFYEKLESQNAKRHKIYKKLVRIAEKKFPALQESVGKAYVEDNKTSIYNLNLLKNKIEMTGGNDILNSVNVNTHQENYNELLNNVVDELKGGGIFGNFTNSVSNAFNSQPEFGKFLMSDEYKIKEIDDVLKAKNFKTDQDIVIFYGTQNIQTPNKPDIIKYVKIVYAIYLSEKAQQLRNATSSLNVDFGNSLV